MRILIIGAGATGGFFGARLAQAGRDVTFLVRAGRAAQLAEHGLQVLSPAGDFRLVPKLLSADAIEGPYEVIILAVKAYTLDSALEDMAAAVGPNTMIMPLLNGMRHVDAITERFGANALVGGVCKINAELDSQGRIVQRGPINDLAYGEMDSSHSARIQLLHAVLSDAGFGTQLSASIKRAMWEKWILLSALGSLNVLSRGSIGEIVAVPEGLAFANRLIDEVVALVAAVGEAPSEGALGQIRKMLTLAGSPQTSSMYRDLSAGAPIEAQQIVGDLLQRGASSGIDTPLLAAAYVSLQVYQQQLADRR
jgi:2-dehydropantoate 2-reductase